MKLNKKDVLKQKVLSVSEFAEQFGDGITNQAVSYAMNEGLVDYVEIGSERFVVMTEHTKRYVPNNNKNRSRRKQKVS